MRVSRSLVVLTAVSAGVAIAACSSSKPTGPSAAKLAAAFDSMFLADSATTSTRTTFDELVIIPLNEGATPTSASVTTDGSALSMQMVGAVLYDTANAAVSDSDVILFGWTSDYSTEVVTLLAGSVGPDLIPHHRIAVSAQRMATIRAMISRLSPGGQVGSRSGAASTQAVVFQGTAAANADTISLITSEAAASGTCTFENQPFRGLMITSASPCTNVTVTETFALHFPATAGIASTLTHMSLTPAKTVHAPRVLVAT
jgi:hypothetical protein